VSAPQPSRAAESPLPPLVLAPPEELTATRVTFIIPAHNEVSTIQEVLHRIEALGLDVQILVVDDGSVDGTSEAAETAFGRMDGLVIRQPNGGKGSAVRAAIPYIDGDVVVIQDADMEYDPCDVPRLIDPILRGAADVVYGSRLSGGQPQRAYMFWHLVGNRFLSLVTSILFNTTLSDMETGYKAFRADVLRSLRLRQNDFRIEPELTSQICLRKLRIYEVPIAYYGRTYKEGKEITWRDGFKALGVLVAARVQSPYGRARPRAND
jgi:glycosyltransferase involved in cell wall biosynthesis